VGTRCSGMVVGCRPSLQQAWCTAPSTFRNSHFPHGTTCRCANAVARRDRQGTTIVRLVGRIHRLNSEGGRIHRAPLPRVSRQRKSPIPGCQRSGGRGRREATPPRESPGVLREAAIQRGDHRAEERAPDRSEVLTRGAPDRPGYAAKAWHLAVRSFAGLSSSSPTTSRPTSTSVAPLSRSRRGRMPSGRRRPSRARIPRMRGRSISGQQHSTRRRNGRTPWPRSTRPWPGGQPPPEFQTFRGDILNGSSVRRDRVSLPRRAHSESQARSGPRRTR
jgi:hypothetical protein